MRTSFALYKNYQNAKAAVDTLTDKNFPKDEINIIVQKNAVENVWDVNERTIDVDVAEKIGTEYVGRKVEGIDEMLGKLRPILTQTAGEIYAAGDVAKVMAHTASAPQTAGKGLQGALIDFGVDDEVAQKYANGVRSGSFLLLVRTRDDRSAEAKKVLIETKASEVSTIKG